MPVPAPQPTRAHSVSKHPYGHTRLAHSISGPLPVPAVPSLRTRDRQLWFKDPLLSSELDLTGFSRGLAVADNASVIKGHHAEACIPPKLTQSESARSYGGRTGLTSNSESMPTFFDVDTPEPVKGHEWSPDAIEVAVSLGLTVKPSLPVGWESSLPRASYSSGSTPPFDKDSPPGMNVCPSPPEAVTPFADFVDRAVATNRYVQGKRVPAALEAYQAPPIFPTIADQPQQTSDTITPTGSVGYKKLVGPLSEWVANYVWKVCTAGYGLPARFSQPSLNGVRYSAAPPPLLAESIHYVLTSTLLQPSAVFLALWYIIRLPVLINSAPLAPDATKEQVFRKALLGDGFETSEASAPYRVALLGLMLANKWLDDHNFSNKTWNSISKVSVRTLNDLEWAALDLFNYDLSISSTEWSRWLRQLMSHDLALTPSGYPQPISRPSASPHSIIRKSVEEIIQAVDATLAIQGLPQPVFLGLEENLRDCQEAAEVMDVLEIDLDEDGPLREEYMPKRRPSARSIAGQASSCQPNQNWENLKPPTIKALPPPAKWSPAGDEPILRDRNRLSAQYVAVQPPIPPVTSYPCSRGDAAYNQNWNPSLGYFPPKTQPGYIYDIPTVVPPTHPQAFPQFGHMSSLPHSRTLSLPYDHDHAMLRNHVRSYSHARFDFDLRAAVGDYGITYDLDSRWVDPASNYPYHGPAYVPLPPCNLQHVW